MARTDRNLDVDLDFSKIKYDSTDNGKKVDSVNIDNNDIDGKAPVVITDTTVGYRRAKSASSKKRSKERVMKSKSRKHSVFGVVIVCMILAVMLVMMVQGRVEISETSMKISDLKNQLSKLEKERNDLNSQIESKLDMLEVEKYAQDSGMVKESSVKQIHVNASSDDNVEIYESEDTVMDGFFGTILSAISESFLRTWNTISKSE